MGKSACAAWVLIWLGCLLGLGVRAESASPEVPIVNLYRGEINGTLFSAMTADTMRSLFGPPSAIEDPERRQEGQGTHVQYHTLGLSFEMQQPREQAPLQCWRVRIYLTKTWDADANNTTVSGVRLSHRLCGNRDRCRRLWESICGTSRASPLDGSVNVGVFA